MHAPVLMNCKCELFTQKYVAMDVRLGGRGGGGALDNEFGPIDSIRVCPPSPRSVVGRQAVRRAL